MPADPSARPLFVPEQSLSHDDMNQVVGYDLERFQRHVLGGHTWGIASGMQLRFDPGSSPPGYVLEPGFAWDGFGRTILVGSAVRLRPDLFRSIRATGAHPRAVPVWARYDTVPSVAASQLRCDARATRLVESFRLEVGERPLSGDRQSRVNVDGMAMDAIVAARAAYLEAPLIEDGSIAFQRFPSPGDGDRWLVPLGIVMWDAAAATFAPPDAGVAVPPGAARQHVGVVAGSVLGPEGRVRLRARASRPSAVTSDHAVWLEGATRVEMQLSLFDADLHFENAVGGDDGVPLHLGRYERDVAADLRVVLGTANKGSNRLTIGSGLGDDYSPRMVIGDDGCVTIDLSDPAEGANAVSFFADGSPIGAITHHNKGVRLTSGGSDFAEAFSVEDGGPPMAAGTVVAIADQAASLGTTSARWVSVVTDQAIVVGNAGGHGAGHVPVTIVGQVPIRVEGTVQVGDLLMPSGRGDGTAVALDLVGLSPARCRQVFAEVVDSQPDAQGRVLARVGGDARATALALTLERLEARLEALADRLEPSPDARAP